MRLCARQRGGARFEVVHDRLDAAGCFLRYTFLIDQEGTAHIDLEAADSLASPDFQHVIEVSGADSELALLLLADLDGLRVQEVIRGQLGPLHFGAVPGPALIHAVLGEVPGEFVLHVAVERAGAAVTAERPRRGVERVAVGPRERVAAALRGHGGPGALDRQVQHERARDLADDRVDERRPGHGVEVQRPSWPRITSCTRRPSRSARSSRASSLSAPEHRSIACGSSSLATEPVASRSMCSVPSWSIRKV